MAKFLKYPYYYIIDAILTPIRLVSFFSIFFFFAASPIDSIHLVGRQLPDHWEAALSNHGQYVQWYSIAQHQTAFVGLIVAFAVSMMITILMYILRAKSIKSGQLVQTGKDKVAQFLVAVVFVVTALAFMNAVFHIGWW